MNKNLGVTDWITGILTIRFDIEEGQLVDKCYPETLIPESLKKLIAYYSFPDSYVNRPEGELYYFFQINFQGTPLNCYVYFNQKKDSSVQRGFDQKSIVLLSRFHCIKIFKKLTQLAFEINFTRNETDNLEYIFKSINLNNNPRVLIIDSKDFILKLDKKEMSLIISF